MRHGAPATKSILATLPGLRPIDAGRVDVLTTRVTSKLTRPEVPPLDRLAVTVDVVVMHQQRPIAL